MLRRAVKEPSPGQAYAFPMPCLSSPYIRLRCFPNASPVLCAGPFCAFCAPPRFSMLPYALPRSSYAFPKLFRMLFLCSSNAHPCASPISPYVFTLFYALPTKLCTFGFECCFPCEVTVHSESDIFAGDEMPDTPTLLGHVLSFQRIGIPIQMHTCFIHSVVPLCISMPPLLCKHN